MSEGESLGKASFDLEANLTEFRRNMAEAHGDVEKVDDALEALAAVSKIAEDALKRVRMDAGQASASSASASAILEGVRGISDEARDAARELGNVKITDAQAAESDIAGDVINRKVKEINRNAGEARRSLESVRLAGAGVGGLPPRDAAGRFVAYLPSGGGSGGGNDGRNGVGVGPFGSGFGRIGVVGSAIGAGVLTAPAAGPAVLGLLASLPVMAATAGGAVGVLALGFDGVAKAIGGDLKAYKALDPEQQKFVMTVRSLSGELDKLKETAAGAMFPGLTEALHSTLSPGTLGAVTTAVDEMGHAVGDAGEMWGKYFGSAEFQSIFGPLMAEGARNLDTMAGGALHLFDAVGVLGRAGIPLTTWMTTGIEKGSELADAWLHAKDASGQLDGAMDEAEDSLRLVGGLLESVIKAAGDLGVALYPVSKVAVKDLTDGFDSLGDTIHRNEAEIRDIVGGALTALVSTIKTTSSVISFLWPWVDKIERGIGGWKDTFELLIGMKIASVVNGWATSFMKLAGAEALGGAETKSAGLLANLRNLKLLGPITIAITVDQIVKGLSGPGTGNDLSEPTASDVVRKGNPYPVGTEVNNAYAAGLAGKAPTTRTTGSPAVKAAYQAGVKAAAAKKSGAGGSGTGRGVLYVDPGVDIKDENPKIKQALTALAKAGYNEKVTSGYRTYAQQAALYAAYVKSGFIAHIAAKPGQSNHETGNAVDLYVNGKPVDQSPGALAILKKYGLVSDVAGDHEHLDLKGAGSTGGTGDPSGTLPPWSKNTGASAAASLAASLSTDKAKLSSIEKAITAEAKQNLLPPELAATLHKQAVAAGAAIADGTKKTLPEISRNLSTLQKNLQEGLAQATDDRKLTGTIGAIQDDLQNKLLTPAVANGLLARAGVLSDQLTSKLLPPAARKKVEENIAALRARLKLDLTLDAEHKTLTASVAELNADVALGLFPPPLEALARKQAKAIGKDIAEGTQAGSAAAKAAQKQLAATIKEGVADATAISNYQQAIGQFKGQLIDKLDSVLGVPATYATPQALDAALAAAAKIMGQIDKGVTGAPLDALKAALAAREKVIEDGLDGLENAVEQAKSRYENGWSRLAQAGQTAFSQVTQTTVTNMQNALQSALTAMQVTVQTAYGSFLFGGSITDTPAAQQLQQLQEAHEDAANQAQLAADTAAGNTAAIAEDQYTILTTKLQRQQTIEQAAAATQLKAAQDAYQDQQQAAIQAYQQQRTLQQQALDDQTADIETAFEQGNLTAADAFDKLTKLYADNGVDLGNLSLTIAGVIYNGVSQWQAPILGLLDDLQARIQALQTALGQASGGAVAALSPGVAARAGIGVGGALPSLEEVFGLSAGALGRAGIGTGGALDIPKLDTGGHVLQTGLAVVHRGEDWSGVGANRRDGDGLHLHLHGGTFIGGNKRQVAADLAPYLGKVVKV